MPHAVESHNDQDQQDEEQIARLLNGQPGEEMDFLNRDLEVGDKADDAQDFEDIGDDDLASEEGSDDPPAGAANAQPYANGYTAPNGEAALDEGDFEDDLFGDDDGSLADESGLPEMQPHSVPRIGLALPSKSQIALPRTLASKSHLGDSDVFESPISYDAPFGNSTFQEQTQSSVTSEPRMEEEDEEEDDEWARQKALFAAAGKEREERARRGSSYEPPPAPETELDLFYSIWPTYDPEKNPRFTELFPPHPGHYNWKTPLKPPKPVNPTKISLDLQQDTERGFRAVTGAPGGKNGTQGDSENKGVVFISDGRPTDQQSSDGVDLDELDENEEIGGVSWRDLTVLCEDWDVSSYSSVESPKQRFSQQVDSGISMDDSWDTDVDAPSAKRRKIAHFDIASIAALSQTYPSLEDPEDAAARVARRVALDMNDPDLLIDENAPKMHTKALRRSMAGMRREARSAMARDMSRRYNISNDEAYELLKENHQHKVRSTLGGVAIDHSLPAVKLQFPFYRVKLEPKQLRSFHRPQFTGAKMGRDIKFSKPKVIKRKSLKGKETREIFEKAEDLTMADNSSAMLLEYSEEMPTMLSNFGMGNRLVNYYRRKDDQDQSRPKEEIGETQVLLPQDRSPFANFGQVDPGELVPAIHNGLYRAPVFKHEGRNTDFLVIQSSSHENGSKFYMRNIENLHVVGQQFPSVQIPGEHSRQVTTAAKNRLKSISYRVYQKSMQRKGPPLTNLVVQDHLPGSDIAQNRGKMREFMRYNKVDQVWEPQPGEIVPDAEAMRSWIRPEDVCMLDAMQVGVQHLVDLGLRDKDTNDDKDADESSHIENQLAPWFQTKNFLNACQGKAMLRLHGEGEPTGRGEGFSFIKTSMKGGFRALGESIEERLDAKKLKENNGHSYNVARQQKAYDESIRRIWRAQKDSLASNLEHSDAEDDIDDEPETFADRRATPRSSIGTPATFARHDDESVSQFSRMSSHKNETLVITRTQRDKYGNIEEIPVTVTSPRVIAAYRRAKIKEQSKGIDPMNIQLTGDKDFDDMQKRKVAEELARLERNMDRREARERAKGIISTPSVANSPGADGAENGDTATPVSGKKGRAKKNTEGTGRRCANCGQVGHIKTNKKLCPMLNGTMKPEDAHTGFGGGSTDGGGFGAVAAAPGSSFA